MVRITGQLGEPGKYNLPVPPSWPYTWGYWSAIWEAGAMDATTPRHPNTEWGRRCHIQIFGRGENALRTCQGGGPDGYCSGLDLWLDKFQQHFQILSLISIPHYITLNSIKSLSLGILHIFLPKDRISCSCFTLRAAGSGWPWRAPLFLLCKACWVRPGKLVSCVCWFTSSHVVFCSRSVKWELWARCLFSCCLIASAKSL